MNSMVEVRNIKLKQTLKEEHFGFAITFEVLCTVAMMFTFFFMILFVLMVMNGQRYMNTVLTSTAVEAARWGGTDTQAYRINVGNEKLIESAQEKLNEIVPEFGDPRDPLKRGPIITGTPSKIARDGDFIRIQINYHLPPFWASIGTVNAPNSSFDLYSALEGKNGLSMSVSIRSIMKAGRLL